MTARTSLSHPLQIAEVSVPGATGVIGITFCPGKKQAAALTGAWDRDLRLDLNAVRAWGAATVITLLEPHELEELDVVGLGPEVCARGMAWLHLPIRDVSKPDHRFEAAWAEHRSTLRHQLSSGARVLVHCKGGLGRAGTVAALLLIELGVAHSDAIHQVRQARKGAIETPEQESYVRSWVAGITA
jgi:ADP-ribosyl-[dinitrogen reductase] hydrolase